MPEADHLNHRPDMQGQMDIERLKAHIITLDNLIGELVHASRERSIALTKLEECRMWAVKGIVMRYPADPLVFDNIKKGEAANGTGGR